MDDEMFLVSRIHKKWLRTGDNRVAVTTGQTVTGRAITTAASIMILVFLSFVLNGNIITSSSGLASPQRSSSTHSSCALSSWPALMHLFGRAKVRPRCAGVRRTVSQIDGFPLQLPAPNTVVRRGAGDR
jgi:RND superfamily putative drug exporter